MSEGIRAPNLPLGTTLGEFIGHEIVGETRSLRRFTRANVIGPIEAVISSFVAGGGVIFTTKAQAALNLNYAANVMAWIIQDPSADNNGVYQKSGTSGSGGWVRLASLPYSFYRATNNGAGTANAIVASNEQPIASEDALVVFNITDENTSETVTVALNGGDPLTIKTASGNAPAVGGLVTNMLVAGYVDGTEFRMISDQASSAIQTAAEAALAAAEAAVSDAQDAADAAIGATGIAQFATKAAAEATTIPASTKHLSLAGYTTAGVGPWRVAVRVASEPSHTAKLRSTDRFLPDGSTDSDDGGWWELADTEVSFAAFGPAADGSADDTTVLNGAIDYVASVKGKLIVPSGNYSVDEVILKSNVHIEFQPRARLIQPDAGSVTGGHVLHGVGAVDTGAAVSLTGNATTGSGSISVAAGDESAFSAGDYVLVSDDDSVFVSGAGKNQEIMVVSSVSSGTITFARYLTTAFTTANNAKIAPLEPVQNVQISGPGEIICGLNRQFGIRMTYPVDCVISGVEVRRSRGGGSFVFQTGYNSHIRGVTARDGQSPGTGGTGYGISFDESCVFCSVKDSHFENLRENTFTNRTRWCVFEGNMCVNMVDSGWNCHGAGSDFNLCQGNIFRDCSQAVAVGWSGGTRADSNNTVQSNFIYRCENGIAVTGNSTGPVIGIGNTIRNNTIQTAATTGIRIFQQSSPIVVGNTIHDASATMTGIYLVSGVSAAMVTGNTLYDLTAANSIGIRSDSTSRATIAHNSVQNMTGASALAFYVPGGTSTNVNLNSYQNVTSGVSLAGAAVNALNSWN